MKTFNQIADAEAKFQEAIEALLSAYYNNQISKLVKERLLQKKQHKYSNIRQNAGKEQWKKQRKHL